MAFDKKVSTQLIARFLIYESRNMITNIYWLNKTNLKIKFMLKYIKLLTIKWLIQKQE